MEKREVIVLPVRYAIGTHAVQATTRALSAEAAWIRAAPPPRAGLRIGLRLYLPEGSPEDLVAQVVDWPGPPGESGFWARFELVGERARARIQRVLHPDAPPGAVDPPVRGSSPGRASSPGASARTPAPPRIARPIDARCTTRVAARLPVRFQSAAALREELSLNVSAGGMFIRTDQPPPLRETVLVSIELPGEGAPIEAQAEVVHRVTPEDARRTGQPAGAGVQFVAGDDRFRERLDAFLARAPRG